MCSETLYYRLVRVDDSASLDVAGTHFNWALDSSGSKSDWAWTNVGGPNWIGLGPTGVFGPWTWSMGFNLVNSPC